MRRNVLVGAMAALAALAALAATGCQTSERQIIERSHSALVGDAQKDQREGRYHAAVQKLENAAKLKPEDALTHFLLGNALVTWALQPDVDAETREREISRGLTHHQTALQLAPDNAPTNYHVGRDYVLLNRPAEALPYLETAQKREPKVAYIDACLGDARRLLKKFDQAIAHYRSGLAKSPNQIATMELHEGLAETYAAQGKTAEALAEFELARRSAISRDRLKRIEGRIRDLKGQTP